MNSKYISLKVNGSPIKKGGFIPIVNINNAFFDVNDVYSTSINDNDCYYTVSSDAESTIYKLVYNRIRVSGGGAQAKLVIAIGVDAGFKLPVDAYTVLHELLDAFLADFAIASDDGWYEYRIGNLDLSRLERVMSQYPLQASGDKRRMNNDGQRAAFITDNIASALDIAANDEYLAYSEVFVGHRINTALIPNVIAAKPTIQNDIVESDDVTHNDDLAQRQAKIYESEAAEVASDIAAQSIAEDNNNVYIDGADTHTPADDGVAMAYSQHQTSENACHQNGAYPRHGADAGENIMYQISDDEPKKKSGRGCLLVLGVALGCLLGLGVALVVGNVLLDRKAAQAQSIVTDTVRVVEQAPADTVYVEKETASSAAHERQSPAAAPAIPPVIVVEESVSEEAIEEVKNQEPELMFDPQGERELK